MSKMPRMRHRMPMNFKKVKGSVRAPNQPNVSMMTPMIICPLTDITTVSEAPRRGNNNRFPVKKMTPRSMKSLMRRMMSGYKRLIVS